MWWIFSLLAASAMVSRNIVMKQIGHRLDEYFSAWSRLTFMLPFALILCLIEGFPSVGLDYWLYAISFGLIISIQSLLFAKAFKYSDISISIALSKIHIIGLLIFGIVFLNETASPTGIIGIVITVFGIYFLNISKRNVSLLQPFKILLTEKGLRYALLSGLLLIPVSLILKQTVLLSNATFPILTNFGIASLFSLILLLKKSPAQFKELHHHKYHFLFIGIFAFLTTIFTNLGFQLASTAYVEAIKQSEIILALFAGMIFFHEHEKIKQIWPGVLIITAGILTIILSG